MSEKRYYTIDEIEQANISENYKEAVKKALYNSIPNEEDYYMEI